MDGASHTFWSTRGRKCMYNIARSLLHVLAAAVVLSVSQEPRASSPAGKQRDHPGDSVREAVPARHRFVFRFHVGCAGRLAFLLECRSVSK